MNGSCTTRYPVMLIHGTGSRDFKMRRSFYWGAISDALKENGAAVYFGGQDAWGSIPENARQLKASVESVLQDTGCEKLNLIAHSKGGLDARYLISSLGMSEYVASLTTVSTPHHGSKTIDWLCKLPEPLFRFAAVFVNFFYRKIGDIRPDFYAVSRGFSTADAAEFNKQNPDMPGILYQSCAGAMSGWRSDPMMMIPYLVIRRFDGENDGLVSVESARWGEFSGILRPAGRRGISHMDEVGILRRPLLKPGENPVSADGVKDIRDVYINIVKGLKEKGL